MAREDFAVRGMMPEMNPYEVLPSYAPMGSGYNLSPEVLAQLADLGVNPYGGGQSPMANPVNSPLAVRGMPEMDPNEVSPLAVQGPVAAQPSYTPGSLDDLSQFGGLGAIGEYRPDFSGAFGGSGSASSLQSAPTSFAIPENYGNPKNKIYNLTANPDDGIRLKLVDGTTIYEGQGPEAAAKASEIIQKLGKDFGTQSTWILDKQTAGGDWKQVSQDTVGEKKKTALNSFLDVAAPIAGAALSVFVPGAAALFGGQAGAAAAGAAGGSLLNSGLQNQNSAEAFKKAAIAAGTTFIGAKIAPNVTSAFKGLTNTAAPLTTAGAQAVTQGGAGALTQAGTGALLDAIPEIVVTGARKGLTALGGGFGAGAGSTLTKTNFNPDKYKVDEFKVEPRQTTDPVIDELVVTGTKTTPLDKAISSTGSAFTGSDFGKTLRDTTTFEEAATETPAEKPNEVTTPNDAELVVTGTRLAPGFDPSIAGAGLGAGLGGVVQPAAPPVKPTVDPIEEVVVTAKPKVDVGALAGAGVQVPVTTPAPNPVIDELVVTAKPKPQPEKPLVPTPVILPNGTLNPDFVNKDFTVDNPEGKVEEKTYADKLQDWIKKNPLQAASLGLTALSGLAAGTKGGTGSGSTGNMPGNIGAAGTRASLSPTFTTGTLPPASSTLAGGALSGTRTPAAMNMSTDDWLRYGLRPEKTFFANSAPVAQEIPIKKARGGAIDGAPRKSRSEFAVHGAGTGRSDDIPAVLSDGEYVLDAETVALLGDGSNKAGAKKLDQFRVNLRRHKGANLAKGRISVNAKSPEKYLAGGRVK